MTMKSTPSLSVPQTQNTAPVFEFNCLYTHDIRRKQKRWQDGFLRFHTFNKRVMVYDVPRNFIGDAHWNAEELQDGDEVTLEKDGVLVQVAESVGRTDTDLTELVRSKRNSSSVAASSSPIRAAPQRVQLRPPSAGGRQVPTYSAPLKHRSLNALLGTPKGRLGKAALPSKSPFEERRENGEEPLELSRPAKKQRINEAPSRSRPLTTRAPTTHRDINVSLEAVQQHRTREEVVDLCSDAEDSTMFSDDFPDDLLASPKPSTSRPQNARDMSSAVQSSSPAFDARKTPGKEKARKRTPPAQAQSARDTGSELRQQDRARDSPNRRSGKVLRIASNAPKRKTLLCQNQLSTGPLVSSNSTDPISNVRSEQVASKHFGQTSQRNQLQQRLDRLATKSKKTTERPTESSQPQSGNDSSSEADGSHVPGPLPDPPPKPVTARSKENTEARPSPIRPIANQRQLRRVISETVHRPQATSAAILAAGNGVPGRSLHQTAHNDTPEEGSTAREMFKAKRPINRTVSLNVTSNGTSTVILNREFRLPQPPRSKDAVPDVVANPWSREAFDLFTWRPPGWDEEGWCVREADTAAVNAT